MSGDPEDSSYYRSIVITRSYDIIEDSEVVGVWTSTRTISHTGPRVVASSPEIDFTDETIEDDEPESPAFIGSEREDSPSFSQSDAVSVGEMTTFAEGRFQDEWVSYNEGLSQAPSIGGQGVNGIFTPSFGGRIEIMIAEWVGQAHIAQPNLNLFEEGFQVDIGIRILTIEGEDTSTSLVMTSPPWKSGSFREDDPDDPQSETGWRSLPPPALGVFQQLEVRNFALNLFPSAYVT